MKIPLNIIEAFEQESKDLVYGEVRLTLKLRNGHPHFIVTKKKTFQIADNRQPQTKEKK